MDFIKELRHRNMLHDMTPGTEEYLANNKIAGYIGFDPTAPSLTIGNYVQIMLLSIFQKHGHQPVVLMGGATGMIGDPSGKSAERSLQSLDQIEENLNKQMEQIKTMLDFEGPHGAVLLNNYNFYKDYNVLHFLRDVGKSLTVNYMMAKDSVKNRIETGLSFTEFSYQLLQAYDFVYLHRYHQCKVQMGGSDQWGNITSGTELIRKMQAGKAYAVTTPLLIKSDGQKFGKSESGNIWMDASLTSPYKFYQFWINAADADIPRFIRYFSLKSLDEIDQLCQKIDDDIRLVKLALASELTERIHGKEALDSVRRATELLFNKSLNRSYLEKLTLMDWQSLGREIPFFTISQDGDIDIVDLLVSKTAVVKSNGEARRAISNNAISVNKTKINKNDYKVTADDWIGSYIMLENGKKNKFLIRRE